MHHQPSFKASIVASPPAGQQGLWLDACSAGMVLRAVALVHFTLVALGLLFLPYLGGRNGLLLGGLVLGCSLPATLLWIVAMCMLRRLLAAQTDHRQWLAGVALGSFCGWFAALLAASVVGAAQTPWAGAVLLGAVFSAQLVWMLQSRARMQAPADVAAQLAELQSRIRPHFLFNALNSALALVRVDPDKAEQVLEDLSELFRHMLRDVRHGSTLGLELEMARRYLEIEQIRFGDRLRVKWEQDPAADLASMPALLMQPLLENAVRHGVEPSPAGASIHIRTELKGNMVRVVVANTCPAGSGRRGNGMALENVRLRLKLLHDMDLYFSARMVKKRFVVRFQVPMQLQETDHE